MIEDFESSGLIDMSAKKYRVIAFDWPGFGHSEWPRSTISPEKQADLIHNLSEVTCPRPCPSPRFLVLGLVRLFIAAPVELKETNWAHRAHPGHAKRIYDSDSFASRILVAFRADVPVLRGEAEECARHHERITP